MTLDETIKRTEELVELNEDQARVYKEQGDTMGYWSYEECAKEHRQLAEWLKELKQLREQPRWIPVSERLPEEYLCNDGYIEPSDYVLVWGDHGNYGVSRYWGNRRSKSESPNTYKDWVDLDWVVQKPVAWMPLPEPYKAESEDKE